MKNIIKSLLIIVAVVAIAGGATWSAYHKEGSVAGVTFSNGDQMDLKIDKSVSGADYEWVDGFTVESPYNLVNVKPGSHGEQIIDIKNVGNTAAKATIRLVPTFWSALGDNLHFTVYFDGDHDGVFDTAPTADGFLSAYTGTYILGNITSGVTEENSFSGQIASVKIVWDVPAEAGNNIMGQKVMIDTVFGLDSI